MPERSLNIACAADARYALPLAVMLRSVAENLDPAWEAEVYALDDGIAAGDHAKVEASLDHRMRIHWLRARRPEGLPTWGRMSPTTYQKLTIADWLPDHVDKALWLDCDLLVLGDVARLWRMPFDGLEALAASDERVPLVSSQFGVAAYRELGLAPEAKYFNAGVMLMDIARWRTREIARRSLDYLHKFGDRVYFWDQEALNAVLANRWGELAWHWNWHPTLNHIGRRHNASGLAEILHFSGNLKPWECDGSGAHYKLYRQYLDRTAFAGTRPARNWRGALVRAYEASVWRKWLYPAELLATRVIRTFTRKYDVRRREPSLERSEPATAAIVDDRGNRHLRHDPESDRLLPAADDRQRD